jgi:hypothetical protein
MASLSGSGMAGGVMLKKFDNGFSYYTELQVAGRQDLQCLTFGSD